MSDKTFRRSGGSFFLQKSASMELPSSSPPQPMATSTLNVPNKLVSFEFPSSPQPSDHPEKMFHFGHHHHPLAKVQLRELFTCAGCKEYGAGKRFACQQCNFQLHEFCAFSPPSLKTHPLHGQHQLHFHSKPKQGGILWAKCDICWKPVKGFTFRCSACSFQMHPCCAMLSTQVSFPVHPHSLKLLPTIALSSGGDHPGFVCGECKRKKSGRVYRCTVCDYHLHAVCAKNMINGLEDNGIKVVPEKPSMLGAAARVASLVIVEFIGGLFEGIGESVGQVLVQDIGIGRCVSRRRRIE
ncbi:protein VACUOLELESS GAMETOPHYTES-like isoform X1 [Actinidia eriantha]|uniref:protein VACUOLELESS GAMETOPHYTES-like isoform X1 n=1 Tax=Actinidia eriantha TaxID=165200 RepID=UPI0025868A8C|nr:protein VACUOLELESS GAMETOPHYTES-like isoform X1 [Actinidia eriantha]